MVELAVGADELQEESRGGVGRSCAWFVLGNSRDRLQIRVYLVVGGAAGAGTWGQVSIGTFRWVRGTWGWAVNG